MVIEGAQSLYSPILFIQWLNQMSLFVNEFSKYATDEHVQSALIKIKKCQEVAFGRLSEVQCQDDVAYLLRKGRCDNNDENLKRAVQLFIEKQFILKSDVCPEMAQDIKKYYLLFFQEILSNLFKQIEELKIKIAQRPTNTSIQLSLDLKSKLLKVVDYSRLECTNFEAAFEPWNHLASAVLAEEPLNHAGLIRSIEHYPNDKKLLFMKILADFILFIPKEGSHVRSFNGVKSEMAIK